MKLFCIGCGPGDPELLTIKAVNLIKGAEIVFAPTAREDRPSIALAIVERFLKKSTKTINLIFPMIKDKELLKVCWKRNANQIADAVRSGKKVLYLTVGDPALYSTWIYVHRELEQYHKDIEINIVPGIASFFAFAAEAKISLVEGDETLAIVPACYDLHKIKKTAISCDTIIFLKDGRYFSSVIDMLMEGGFPKDSMIGIAQDISSGRQIMKTIRLSDLQDRKSVGEKYFSIMVAKKIDDRG